MRRTRCRKSKKRIFRNCGTPGRSTKRQKSHKMTFRNYGTPVRRTRRRTTQKHDFVGLLCVEQNVRNPKTLTFRKYGNPVRRTRLWKSKGKCISKDSGTPVRRRKRRKAQKMDFQEFWDCCAQNKTSENSTHGLSRILGLLWAEQDAANLNRCTFRISGIPVRSPKIVRGSLLTERYHVSESPTL